MHMHGSRSFPRNRSSSLAHACDSSMRMSRNQGFEACVCTCPVERSEPGLFLLGACRRSHFVSVKS